MTFNPLYDIVVNMSLPGVGGIRWSLVLCNRLRRCSFAIYASPRSVDMRLL